MTYQEAVEYLESRERFGIRLGLANILRLLNRLDNPQKGFPSFHIAGTNGKGSTAAMLAAILSSAGYRTGLYTSPHLWDVCERIQIDGRPIARKEFASLIASLVPVVEELSQFPPHSPTYFESLTAAAFLYFCQKRVDYAVVEVGMGGRLDATNVVTPLVSVITPIGLEHRRYLGNTLAAIAREKAGIIKEGRPVVVGKQVRSAFQVINKVARERGCAVYSLGKNITWTTEGGTKSSFSFHIKVPGLERKIDGVRISLPGTFQVENAATACLALTAAGLSVKEEVVRQALKEISWPGRLQVVSRKPLIIFDVSHNPPAIKTLLANLSFLYPKKEFKFLCGLLKDKDYRSILKLIGPFGKEFYFTRPDSHRSREPEELKSYFQKVFPNKPCRVVVNPRQAYFAARKEIGEKELLCICGSFYLASALKG